MRAQGHQESDIDSCPDVEVNQLERIAREAAVIRSDGAHLGALLGMTMNAGVPSRTMRTSRGAFGVG